MKPIRALAVLVLTLACARGASADEFDSKGVKIHYVVEGKGEPVVLLHGFESSAAMNWRLTGVIRALAPKYQVIALDCRGHGLSGKPAGDDQYGLEMVEDVARLLDHLKIDKAQIVGYSMGGMIAMKFMVLHPERTLSGILGGMGWLKSGSPLERFWEKLPGREEGRGAPAACSRGFSQLGVTEDEVKGIKVPVSIIIGDQDPCRKLYVEPLTRVRSDWPVTTIEGGHLACIVKEGFRDAVKAGVDAHAGK